MIVAVIPQESVFTCHISRPCKVYFVPRLECLHERRSFALTHNNSAEAGFADVEIFCLAQGLPVGGSKPTAAYQAQLDRHAQGEEEAGRASCHRDDHFPPGEDSGPAMEDMPECQDDVLAGAQRGLVLRHHGTSVNIASRVGVHSKGKTQPSAVFLHDARTDSGYLSDDDCP